MVSLILPDFDPCWVRIEVQTYKMIPEPDFQMHHSRQAFLYAQAQDGSLVWLLYQGSHYLARSVAHLTHHMKSSLIRSRSIYNKGAICESCGSGYHTLFHLSTVTKSAELKLLRADIKVCIEVQNLPSSYRPCRHQCSAHVLSPGSSQTPAELRLLSHSSFLRWYIIAFAKQSYLIFTTSEAKWCQWYSNWRVYRAQLLDFGFGSK